MECKDDSPPNAAVDTSRPFGSVKEAVAIFGERILDKEARNLPKPSYSMAKPKDGPWSAGMLSPRESPREDEERGDVEHALKKLEAELSEAKEELKLLKKKETETEVAVAALNAELHRSMSRLAKAEAAAAAKEAATMRSTGLEKVKEERAVNEGEKAISPHSQTLEQILSVPENQQEGEARDGDAMKGNKKRMMMTTKKKKQMPVVPLVWELFSWRKTNADDIHKSFYYSSPHLFN